MEAPGYGSSALRQPGVVPSAAIIRASAAGFLTALLCFATAVLLARRWVGALNGSLAAAALISVGIAAALTAEAIRALDRRSNRFSERWLPRLALPLAALAVSLPGSSVFGLVALWLIVGGEEWRAWRSNPIRAKTPAAPYTPFSAPAALADRDRRALEQSLPAAEWHDPAIAQRIAYRSTAEGNAIVEGWLRATFIAGQQTAIVHVAFCPPFLRAPQVETEPVNGPTCDIRSTLVVPWGIRWEVRLVEPAAAAVSVVFEFFAAEGYCEPTDERR